MGLKYLTAVTCTAADTAYQVTTSHILAHRVWITTKPGNAGAIYIGTDDTLKPSTNTGVAGIIPVPAATINAPFQLGEENAPNGVDLAGIWIASSSAGDIVYVGYYES